MFKYLTDSQTDRWIDIYASNLGNIDTFVHPKWKSLDVAVKSRIFSK